MASAKAGDANPWRFVSVHSLHMPTNSWSGVKEAASLITWSSRCQFDGQYCKKQKITLEPSFCPQDDAQFQWKRQVFKRKYFKASVWPSDRTSCFLLKYTKESLALTNYGFSPWRVTAHVVHIITEWLISRTLNIMSVNALDPSGFIQVAHHTLVENTLFCEIHVE